MSDSSPQPRRTWGILCAFGVLIATLGALCGIGGGLFATPLQHFGFKVPLRRAVSTSLVLVFCTAVSATLAESLSGDSSLHWGLALAAIPSALLGTQFGMRVSEALPTRHLKGIFSVTFVVIGLRMLLAGDSSGAQLASEVPTMAYASMVLLGLLAGVIVPVLGIGGGLLMVPGCLLLVPEVGWEGARSLSLAIASFTSLRAVWLHHRAGRVDFSRGLPLGVGALVGAAIGVHGAHIEGAGTLGQTLLGMILIVSAWRFGRDALRQA